MRHQPSAPQFSLSQAWISFSRASKPPAGGASLIRTANRFSTSPIISLGAARERITVLSRLPADTLGTTGTHCLKIRSKGKHMHRVTNVL